MPDNESGIATDFARDLTARINAAFTACDALLIEKDAEIARLSSRNQEMSDEQRGLIDREEEHRLGALVYGFAANLLHKLVQSEKKYGWKGGWANPGWMDECRAKLREHVEKGDPFDVAAYCAFLWYHDEETT